MRAIDENIIEKKKKQHSIEILLIWLEFSDTCECKLAGVEKLEILMMN